MLVEGRVFDDDYLVFAEICVLKSTLLLLIMLVPPFLSLFFYSVAAAM